MALYRTLRQPAIEWALRAREAGGVSTVCEEWDAAGRVRGWGASVCDPNESGLVTVYRGFGADEVVSYCGSSLSSISTKASGKAPALTTSCSLPAGRA